MKTLIKNGTVITMDEERTSKYEKLDILIIDDKIKLVTDNYEGEYDKLIDASDKIVMPGLINTHTHLGMSIFRATNDNLKLQEWLENKIWPIEDNMTEDDIYYTTLLSCLEMIKTGTTCASDMYFGWKGIMKALKETKMRSVMSRCLIGDNDESGQNKINELKKMIELYKNDELTTFTVSPHALYTCSKEYLKECSKLAEEYNLPVHIHFSENKSEVENIKKEYEKTPVEALEEVGLLDHKIILAHGTYISEEEQKILEGKDVSVATNPISNLNLGCGIADITSYLRHGINVSLGTDGQGSGNNLNLFRHLPFVANLQKAKYEDPTIMSSYDVLKIATVNGAKALGLEEKIGKIKNNFQADIIILDLNEVNSYPYPDLLTQIVNNVEMHNVITTIINGDVLMEDRELKLDIDETLVKNKVKEICDKLAIK